MAVKEKFKNRAGKLTGEGEKANLLQKIKRKLKMARNISKESLEQKIEKNRKGD